MRSRAGALAMLALIAISACAVDAGSGSTSARAWAEAQRRWGEERDPLAWRAWAELDPATHEGREAQRLLTEADALYREGIARVDSGVPDVRRCFERALLLETTPRRVDVKLVAATNADLRDEVRSGAFRADLYARLNPAARLVVPPLRERIEDLPELARAFVRRKLAARPDRARLAEYLVVARLRAPVHAELQIVGARRAVGTGAPRPPARGVGGVLARTSFAELARHQWRGNVRASSSSSWRARWCSLSPTRSRRRARGAGRGATPREPSRSPRSWCASSSAR